MDSRKAARVLVIEYRHKGSIPAAAVWVDSEAAPEEMAVMHGNSDTAKVYEAVDYHAAFGLGGGMDVHRYMQEGDPAAF